MKKYYLLVIFFSFYFYAISQEAPKIKFGKVTEDELKMKTYDADTSAAAVILYDDGNSLVTYDTGIGKFMLNFERVLRIKILKESGKDWGNVIISLYSSNQTKEELKGIDGVTSNLENGKIEKSDLKRNGIFKERENKFWESVKISLPSVKVGSVIDLKYSVSSPLLWNLQPWRFQYSIPVKWSHLLLTYPEYFKYNHSSLGYYPLCLSNHTTKGEKINYSVVYEGISGREREARAIEYTSDIFEYAAKDVPAFKEEPYSTSMDNFTTRLKFEIASVDFSRIGGDYKNYTNTWVSINNDLLNDEDFGGQISGGGFLEDDVKKITSGITSDIGKTIALYSVVQKTMKWDKYKSYSASKSLKKIYSEKTGNSADLNLLLLVMLQKAGIKANPVILSTRDHGIISPVHPSISDCNYVVIKANFDEGPLFLDVTDPQLPAGQLPLYCMNGKGIVIKKDTPEETSLAVLPATVKTLVSLELVDGKLKGSSVSMLAGLDAYNFRNDIKIAGGKKEYFDKLKNKSKEIDYQGFDYAKVDSLYSPVEKKYNFILSVTSEDNSIIYINPILFSKTTQNPFTSPTRTYPVDFGIPFIETYTLNFTIPDGYKVEELPKSKSLMLGEKDARFQYSAGLVDNKVIVNIKFSIDKPVIVSDEYPNLKEFFDRVIAKESEQIVLKKI
jgi:hypothetical protein